MSSKSSLTRLLTSYHCGICSSCLDSDEPVTYISPTSRLKKSSSMDRHTPRPKIYSSVDPSGSKKVSKSSTLPSHRSDASSSKMMFTRPPNPDLPGFPYRAPSPVNGSGEYSRQGGASPVVGGSKAAGSKRSIFRRRADSVDNYKIRNH